MTARVTMRDVAQAAGVSPMTVSRTFKRDGSVNADTRRLVRETADRLGYVYDGTAQAFRAQRSGFVAVTLPSINNANFAATHRALTRQLSDTGLQILLGITGYGLEEEERLVRQLLARRPEAIVMTGGTHTDDTRAMIRALKAPTIEIWDLPVEPLGHVVGFSNADAMAKIVTHLAETGRTRLAFIGATGDSDHRGAARRHGAVERARALGLPEIEVIEAGDAPVSMSAGADAVKRLGGGVKAFDALVCVSDPVAFGAMSQCARMGMVVPDDIAVTGFGAFEIAGICVPTLTTIDVGAGELGRATGALIKAVLADGALQGASRRIDQTPRLIKGDSS